MRLNYKYFFSINAVLFAFCSTSSFADTVTVNKTQPEVVGSNYQTINAALNYIKTTAEPRIVNITDGGTYLEGFALNYSVTIRGVGSKPVIVTPKLVAPTPSSLRNHGIAFYTNAEFPGGQNFNLENLTILPSTTDIPTHAMRSNNNHPGDDLNTETMNVSLKDVLITANKGDNTPVTLTGLESVDLTGATVFGDDGFSVAGYTNVSLEGTVITHIRSASGNTSSDGIVFNPDVANFKLEVGPGCVFSYLKRIGIQVARSGSIVEIAGAAENPVIFKGIRTDGAGSNGALSLFTSDGTTNNGVTIDHALFIENNGYGILGALVSDTASAPSMTVTNSAFVSNGLAGLGLTDNMLTGRTWTIENCTFINNGLLGGTVGRAIEILNGGSSGNIKTTGAFLFKNSIIAGNGQATNAEGNNRIDIQAEQATVTFENSALVTAGPYALGAGTFRLGTDTVVVPAPTEINVINADPQIAEITNITSPSYLDVANGLYVEASSTGSALSGYGDYVGPQASVTDWSTY